MSLIALHGFSLTGAMFDEMAAMLDSPLQAPDLPGHGGAGPPATLADAVSGVVSSIDARGAPVLGYSMGGRVALLAALERPDLVSHLILVSTSPGLEDAAGRSARRAADDALAAAIERDGVAAFLDGWLAAPMFAGLAARTEEWRGADRARRLGNRADGLAAALRGMGQGAMPYVGDRLAGLAMPVLAVAGEADRRYADLAAWMADRIPDGRVALVPGAGHSVVAEAPGALAALVGDFLAREP